MKALLTEDEVNAFVEQANAQNAGCTAAALAELAAVVGRHHDLYVQQCPTLFPLSPFTAQRVSELHYCLGFVQEVHSAVGVVSLNPNRIFSRGDCPAGDGHEEGGAALEMVDAHEMYVIPVPGAGALYHRFSDCGSPAMGTSHAATPRRKRERDSERLEAVVVGPLESGSCAEAAVPDKHDWEKLNLPHPPVAPELLTGCVVTVLGSTGLESVRLHDVVEVLCFIQSDPSTADDSDLRVLDDDDFGPWHEDLPRNRVSRAVAVHVKKVDLPNLRLPAPIANALLALEAAAARAAAVSWISRTVCHGDDLAAEYVMLALCSGVVHRHAAMPVGDLPLYLWFPSAPESETIAAQLRLIAPVASICVRAHQDRLLPRKNHDRNVLESGVLQCAPGTTVVLDASPTTSSTLLSLTSCDNVNDTLFSLLHRQRLTLDFVYSTYDIDTEAQVIVVSSVPPAENPLQALNLGCTVRVSPKAVAEDAASVGSQSELVRAFLSQVRGRLRGAVPTSTELSSHIAEDIFQTSRECPELFNGDPVMHNNTVNVVVSLCRLHAATFGREVTLEDYLAVKHLERQRASRMPR